MDDSPGAAKTRKSAGQFLRYVLIGILSNSLGYLFYLLITYLGVEPKRAMTPLYVVGAIIGFLGNRQWAFAHKGNGLKSAVRYCIAHLDGYLLNLIILFVFVDFLGYPHQLVQAGAIIGVACFLFVAFKYIVFPEGKHRSGSIP
ncbi:MAG: GtrA family protein [Deltaproteobacteria bacterium]|nr:GtrA family protein [Deltaproteobacteria bacterium]